MGKCEDCKYYDDNDRYTWLVNKYLCKYYNTYYFADDGCPHFVARSESNSGCYITTIICDILGYPDDNPMLNCLRSFRNNILQKEPKYIPTLLQYDVIGPKIAKKLKEDNNQEYCHYLLESYLLSACNFVNANDYSEAVKQYKSMTEELKEKYSISSPFVLVKGYNSKQGGHGKLNGTPITLLKRPKRAN